VSKKVCDLCGAVVKKPSRHQRWHYNLWHEIHDGTPGPQGPAGPQGIEGPTGPKGDAAPAGPTASAGPTWESFIGGLKEQIEHLKTPRP